MIFCIESDVEAVRKDCGTKCAAHVQIELAPFGSSTVKLRFRLADTVTVSFIDFDTIFSERKEEADEFYKALQRGIEDADSCLVQGQALASLIWSKQFYYFDVRRWLEGDPTQPPPPSARRQGRNSEWQHLSNAHIVSMPDKWEYPWYASWDFRLPGR